MTLELVLPRDRNAEAKIERLAASRLEPFAAPTLAFVADFSRRLLEDPGIRAYPELVALGYWFRASALHRLRERHAALGGSGVLRPRGVVFQIAPSNVDSIFVYSWLLSMLCGNRNIVRLSSRGLSDRQAKLLVVLDDLLRDPRYASIAEASALLRYEHDDAITAALSARCHLRVIWGGDSAVQAIRKIPLPPLANELAFSNRWSWSVIDAETVLEANSATLEHQANGFYNDVFWFVQQACSSPRAVLWIGHAAAIGLARKRFWPALASEIARREARNEACELSARVLAAHLAASDENTKVAQVTPLTNQPLRLECAELPQPLRDHHPGYGLLYELCRPSLSASSELFVGEDQSIAYWGFSREGLAAWLPSLPDRAVDRLVPLGRALQFADTWDGNDLLQSFSRQVSIE